MDISTLSAEEIVAALKQNPTLLYDVGMAIYEANPSKTIEFVPANNPDCLQILLTGYTDRTKALQGTKKAMGFYNKNLLSDLDRGEPYLMTFDMRSMATPPLEHIIELWTSHSFTVEKVAYKCPTPELVVVSFQGTMRSYNTARA